MFRMAGRFFNNSTGGRASYTRETTTHTTTKMTKAQINRAIRHTGLTIQGTRGDGYFYFLDTEGNQVGDSVMVCYLRQLPLHRWVRLAEQAIG